MSFKKFKMAAGRHFEKGAVAQIPQRYKNSIRSYFVQDHLNYQKMQKPRLPLSGVPSLCWHPDYCLDCHVAIIEEYFALILAEI